MDDLERRDEAELTPGLEELARHGEAYARPLDAERVRSLGTRRRRRRAGLAAAAGVIVLAGAGTVIATGGLGGPSNPDPAASPTASAVPASPAPARTVTEQNLLRPGDVRGPTGQLTVAVVPPGVGRTPDTSSVCIPDSLAALGPTAIVERNFALNDPDPGQTPDPGTPGAGQPDFYTQALQFTDVAAAQRAVQTYQGWLDDCRALLASRQYTVLGSPERPVRAVKQGGRTLGTFTEVIYREPGDRSELGWFESVGLTRVDDRVMVTVMLSYGMDLIRSYGPEDVAQTGAPLHEQFGLITAAAERLR